MDLSLAGGDILTTERLHQTLTLADGRTLGVAECGDPRGVTVFHFHASGSSRLERPADEAMLADLGIRFVTTDRPGHGLSDPKAEHALLEWPDDVAQLADHLGIDRFYVMGWSAGGAPALACAFKLPERVRAVALVSSIAPPDCPGQYRGMPLANRLWKFGARRMPALVRTLRRAAYPIIMGDLEEAGRSMSMSFPLEDRRLLDDPAAMKRFAEDIQEGYTAERAHRVHDATGDGPDGPHRHCCKHQESGGPRRLHPSILQFRKQPPSRDPALRSPCSPRRR